MRTLDTLFGESPFEHLVEHARKIHECVALVRPVADAIVAGDLERLRDLQHQMSKAEHEADLKKDQIRQQLPHRFFLPVSRDDILNFVRQLDKMGDDSEDFAVVATFRKIELPKDMQPDFLDLADKVVQVSEALLALAEQLATLQKESFEGPDAQHVLQSIQEVCHLEWESDKLSRRFARRMYASDEIDTITVMLLDKLCQTLSHIADHAENTGKNLRLMIIRK